MVASAAEVVVPTVRECSLRPSDAELARIARSLVRRTSDTMPAPPLYVPQVGTRSRSGSRQSFLPSLKEGGMEGRGYVRARSDSIDASADVVSSVIAASLHPGWRREK